MIKMIAHCKSQKNAKQSYVFYEKVDKYTGLDRPGKKEILSRIMTCTSKL